MQFIKDIFISINDIFLKMTWLENIINKFLEEVIGMDITSLAFKGVSFFFFDVIKIFILLTVLIYISSYIQSFLHQHAVICKLMRESGCRLTKSL